MSISFTTQITNIVQGLFPYCNISSFVHQLPAKSICKVKHLWEKKGNTLMKFFIYDHENHIQNKKCKNQVKLAQASSNRLGTPCDVFNRGLGQRLSICRSILLYRKVSNIPTTYFCVYVNHYLHELVTYYIKIRVKLQKASLFGYYK